MAISTLFIPDISGFTKFVKTTEINHGRHIIEELINLVIKEGSKTFSVAEVEGDAVFFFKYQEKLSLEQIEVEAKNIFGAFNKHLQQYEYQRICNCGACSTAVDLKLKFVSHSGEINLANFAGEKEKPFGPPVIAVHRLLKSKIGLKEYVLFSDDFINGKAFEASGKGSYQDKELGEVNFQYQEIGHWKEEISLPKELNQAASPDVVAKASISIPSNIEVLHDFVSDFKYRHLWNKGADEIIYDESKVNRAGMEHYCIIDGKNLFFDTVKPKVNPEQRSYGEVLKNPAPLKYFEANFVMTPIGEEETLIELKLSGSVKWLVQRPIIPLMRKKFKKQAEQTVVEISNALKINLQKVA